MFRTTFGRMADDPSADFRRRRRREYLHRHELQRRASDRQGGAGSIDVTLRSMALGD